MMHYKVTTTSVCRQETAQTRGIQMFLNEPRMLQTITVYEYDVYWEQTRTDTSLLSGPQTSEKELQSIC